MLRGIIVFWVSAFVLGPMNAGAVTFHHVVTLGDSLMDDPDGTRSPVAAEHVAERLGAPLTKFARSGATSKDLVQGGQHTRAAAQFGTGDLAMLWIGGNDFFRKTFNVVVGSYGFIDDLEANVDTTLSTLRGAGMEVVVMNLPDLSNVPLTDGISNFRKATQQWNDRLDLLAETHDATVVDVFELFEGLANTPNEFPLLGQTPNLDGIGCQLCVFADSIHPSSFAQGFIANAAIAAINAKYDPTQAMPLQPLSIVEVALLADLYGSDFDGNGLVDAGDLAHWQSNFGATGSDADGDNDTDGNDFLLWQQQLGATQPLASQTHAIPEPATATLALLLLILVLGQRLDGSTSEVA